ncbi:redoxin domain-containing protein [Leptobacterium flavescens]|uniref:thioredoxin-dependent peroxiredoxin n=1 Tax=Leptobacterium flavescens TaxID=472055 RepID=A0A6P0UTS2_9FLAO|nr:peroxiredoxin-like family protein [Leptobacterium flavescens]NER13826.1 redoxin domain-containing protein [Leptobacterium flavescens]
MSLKDQLEARLTASKKAIPAEKRVIMENATNELLAKEISRSALGEGDTAPDFRLSNATGKQVSLSEVLKEKIAVVSFYRGGWCPYCNIELKALQSVLPQIKKNGAQLIAISPEQPDKSLSTQEKNELSFEVLSDVNNKTAKDFGLVFRMPDELQKLYHEFGLHVDDYNGNDDYELPMPATYVIDKDRKIIYSFTHEDYTKRAEPSKIIAVLESL